jgi:hypothetical protein
VWLSSWRKKTPTSKTQFAGITLAWTGWYLGFEFYLVFGVWDLVFLTGIYR